MIGPFFISCFTFYVPFFVSSPHSFPNCLPMTEQQHYLHTRIDCKTSDIRSHSNSMNCVRVSYWMFLVCIQSIWNHSVTRLFERTDVSV